jgi:hypothetical protein
MFRLTILEFEVLFQNGPQFAGNATVIGLSARQYDVVVVFIGGE